MVLAGIVVAAGGVNEYAAIGLAIAVAVGKQLEQRLALDLRHRIPHRHVDRAYRHRALPMAARLFVLEHGVPDLVGIEIAARGIDKRIRLGPHDAGDEPFAHELALAIATI
ncbi:hypothetical protein D3C71_1716700 [compost metagenome]